MYTKRPGLSNMTKGLIIEGVELTWKEVELQHGFDNGRFRKRAYTNPHWPLGKVLTKPIRAAGGMRKPIHQRKRHNVSMRHDPWELERNKVACGRWK